MATSFPTPERSPAGTDLEKPPYDGSAGESLDSVQDLDPVGIPDGGLVAWSVVFGSWCVLFTSFGWVDCIGLFQNHYQIDQLKDYSPSTIAWITSVEVYIKVPLPCPIHCERFAQRR